MSRTRSSLDFSSSTSSRVITTIRIFFFARDIEIAKWAALPSSALPPVIHFAGE